ncbi:MAG: AsmA-like C-terminal region-containing protein [Chitinispirillaceae bacterium]
MKVKTERVATVVLLLVSILILVGFVPFRLSFLENRVADTIKRAGADSIQIEEVTVKLWQGVRISGLKTVKNLDKEKRYTFSAYKIDVSCNLIPAAFSMLVHDAESFKGDLFRKAYENPSDMFMQLAEAFSSVGAFRSVSVNGGSLNFQEKSRKGVSADGFILKLQKNRSGKSFKGRINVSEFSIPSLAEVEKFSARLTIKENRLLVRDGKGDLFSGKLRCETGIDLLSSELLPSKLMVDGLALEQFCSQSGFSLGELKGKVNLETSIEPGKIHLDSLKGKGSLRVSKANAIDLPLQKSITVNLVSPKLTNLHFKTVNSDFLIANGCVNFRNLDGIGNIMDFKAHGWIRHDGRMNMRMEGFFSSEFSEELKNLVKFSLEKTDRGRRKFKCRIRGTFEYPQIEIDGAIYQRAAGNVLGNMKQGLKNIFK